jgi:sugar lactone lactonase YvrE
MGIPQYKAEVLIDRRFLLAEGPVYVKKNNTLLFVDINAGQLYIYDFKSRELDSIRVGQHIGAAVPAVSGKYLAAMATGLYLVDENAMKLICRPKELTANLRLNDAKCDPSGRFLFGSIPLFSAANEPGSLLSLEKNGSYKKLDVVPVISNGMAWSADGKTMYYNDSETNGVDAFDYRMETGEISNRRRVFTTKHHPDGMTIDAEGMLWVALWGGYKVARVNPANGEIIGEVPIPAECVSSCCFGGAGHTTLFITTSGEWDEKNPGAGRVYVAETGVKGTEAVIFDDSFWRGA